jgi:phage terminase large subunit
LSKAIDVQFTEALRFLFEPSRYKILYGGRGGGKSHSIAKALLILGAQKPLRIFCGREIQKSIADSVHKLLGDQIRGMGLEGFYQVLQANIRGANGTEFIFAGLKHNISNIKSLEAVDIAWIEEAQSVSKTSWDVLIPTIRKEASEIWVSFNPELEGDNTYQRFVAKPPTGAIVVKVNWSDNPFFPNVLRQELEDLKARDYDAYLTVWEGHCKQVLDGAIYAKELREATMANRITSIPYDATKPVHTFWDLGWADMTSIWFAQSIGFECRVVDFYQNHQHPLQHYIQTLQSRGYVYGTDWLPHDAQAKQLGSGRSIEELLRAAGRNVKIVPRLSVNDGINAVRTLFNRMWFDAEKCADGLQALRRYRYDLDDAGHPDKVPVHDDASHSADALRYMAVAMKEEPRPRPKAASRPQRGGSMAWMGR